MTIKRLKYAIILFYLALFAFLGLYDERLNPELMRELAKPRPKVIEPGNAWLVMLGIDAPAGTAPVVAGEMQLKKLDAAIQSGKNPGETLSAELDDKYKLSFSGKLPSFYGKKNVGILAYAKTHPDEVAILCRDNAELLGRYEQLHLLSRYSEPLTYGFYSPMPKFSPTRSIQQLHHLRVATQARHGSLNGALIWLRDDMAFWRLVAQNSRTVISKIISFAVLSTDLRFAAELGAAYPLTNQELALIQEILRPFDKGISYGEAFRGEALFGHFEMEISKSRTMTRWSPERLVFKHNAISNRLFTYNSEFARQAELTPQQYAEERKRQATKKSDPFKMGISALYNSTGEILALIAIPNMSGYIEQGHNLEGLRRLALLKVLAHAENVSPERMQTFLDTRADLGNPYTGKPMTWDPKGKRISFPKLSGDGSVEIYL